MSGPLVFCEFRLHGSSEKGIERSRVGPLSSAVVCIEGIPAYIGMVVLGCYRGVCLALLQGSWARNF